MERNLCLRLLYLFIYVSYYIPCNVYGSCTSLSKSPGYTIPEGDIFIKYGGPLNITCRIERDLKPNEMLFFKRNTDKLQEEMYIKLDSRSIQLYIEHPVKTANDMYYCFLKSKNGTGIEKLVCMNTVVVGVAPQNITDFGCVGQNFDSLTCGFTMPENNVNTEYHTSVQILNSKYPCRSCAQNKTRYECYFNLSTEPQYRSSRNTYKFLFKMENYFGKNENNFTIDTYKHVIPNPPENITGVSHKPYQIHLRWLIPIRMLSFPKGMHYRVLYQCEGDPKWVQAALGYIKQERREFDFNLTNLTYSHRLYDIRVALRSAVADDRDESMWSKNASITIRTKSTLPDEPPQTVIGSFDISAPDYLIYWKQIDSRIQNGDGFGYHVQLEDNHSAKIEVGKAFAKIKGLSPAISYTFYVWSNNSEGLSKNNSQVVIPRNEDRVSKHFKVVKIEHGGFHQLSWEKPELRPGQILTNYTVFWCKFGRDRPYQCNGDLMWTTVPGNIQEFNQTLDESVYQYAISANTHNSTSGMVWAECTVLKSGAGNMKDVYSEVHDTWMMIHWSWDCSNTHKSDDEYVITYCPTNKTEKKCKEPVDVNLKNVTIKDPETKGKITNLIPYTTYMIKVYIKSKNEELRLQNDGPLFNTTNEGAPSPPQNLITTEITNSSISISWEKPRYTNGILKNYNLYINNEKKEIETCENKCTYTVSGSESYKNYTIYVEACTVVCSERSKELFVRTLMGTPGEISSAPVAFYQNSTSVGISWNNPYPPRGKIDYFEVSVRQKGDDIPKILIEKRSKFHLQCSTVYDSFEVSVRAVNKINGTPVPGPWSNPLHSYCRVKPTFLIYIIIIVGVIIGAIFLYGSKRAYSHCKLMSKVEVKLPPGLAPAVTDQNLWTLNKHNDDLDRSPSKAADEQVLLLKIKEGHVASVDTSGCSSGQESVASSLESGPVSGDSGTDQLATDESKRNSLRQRNVPTKAPTSGYILPTDPALANTWLPKPPPPSNYCKVGDTGPKKEESSPYVTIDKVSELGKVPFITTPPISATAPLIPPDIVKMPNPSYISFPTTEPPKTSKSGYVVAGTRDFSMPETLSDPASVEDTAHYVQAADTLSSLKEIPWQQAPMEKPHKTGYVSVGDAAPPMKTSLEHKGYVPHRPFESKTLKED